MQLSPTVYMAKRPRLLQQVKVHLYSKELLLALSQLFIVLLDIYNFEVNLKTVKSHLIFWQMQ